MAWYTDDTRGQNRYAWGYFDDKARNNAWQVYNYFTNVGATVEAISGLLGNISYESRINPGQEQVGGTGLGLIQWTPPSDLYDNVIGNWLDGDAQCDVIYREGTGVISGKWFPKSGYNYSWTQFLVLTDITEATKAYFYERERGTWSDYRITLANYWYEVLTGEEPPTPPPPPPPPVSTKRKRMPLYMIIGNNNERR